MLHPALSQALATAHIEDLHRAAAPRHDGRQTIWVMVDHLSKRIRYSRIADGLTAGTIAIEVPDSDKAATQARVTYDLPALGTRWRTLARGLRRRLPNRNRGLRDRNSRSARTAAVTCRDPSAGRASAPRTAPSLPGFRQSRTRRGRGARGRDAGRDAPGFARRQGRRASSLLPVLSGEEGPVPCSARKAGREPGIAGIARPPVE
jgi:hypothetical protein